MPKIPSYKDGRHPMTSHKGVPYILSENVVYKLDVKTKKWMAIARIPSAVSDSNYRVGQFVEH